MEPLTSSNPTAVSSKLNGPVEARNSNERKVYKEPTRGKFQIIIDNLLLTPREASTEPIPRETYLAQSINDKVIFTTDHNIHQVCPEWLREKLYVNRVCGSKKAVHIMRDLGNVYYVFDYCIALFICIVFPAIGLTTLGFAVTTPETVPTWFPYIGMFFYIVGVPMFCTSVMMLKHHYAINIDDKRLKQVLAVVIFVAFVCSPIYGIWATVSYTNASAIVVEDWWGLNTGAYACCALCIPCWIFTLYPVAFSFAMLSDEGWREQMILMIIFLALTGLLVGSMTHQILVGELVWFPYIGVLGVLFILPFCVVFGLLLLSLLECCKVYPSNDTFLGKIFVFVYVAITDVMAWLLAEKDLSQPIEFLIDDPLLYAGAVAVYIAGTALWLKFVTGIAAGMAERYT